MLFHLLIGDFFLIPYCLETVSLYYLNKQIRNQIKNSEKLKRQYYLNILLLLKKWIFDKKLIVSNRIFNDICCYHLYRLPTDYKLKLKEHILFTHYPIAEKTYLYGKKGEEVHYYTDSDLYSFGTLPKYFRVLFLKEFYNCKMEEICINLYDNSYIKKCYIIYELNSLHRKLIIDLYITKKYEMFIKYYILYWFRLKKQKIKFSKCLRTLFFMIYNNCDYSKMQLENILESIGYILSNINTFKASLLSQIELYIQTKKLQIGMEAREYLTIIS